MARRTKAREHKKPLSADHPLPDLSQALGMSMLRAREILVAPIRPVLRSLKLTDQQWRILRLLSTEPSLNATTLARRTVILLPSLSRIVTDLEQKGLVRKFMQGAAGRPRIAITAKGRTLVTKALPKIVQKQKSIHEGIGEKNIEQLLRILGHIEGLARNS